MEKEMGPARGVNSMDLWRRATQRASSALASGALEPIETTAEIIEDGGIQFVVRVVESLAKKDEVRRALDQASREREGSKGKRPNPFLPYDEELFVCDVSETHLCLLNKFNVIDNHLLIVTRDFEDQEELLSLADFEALLACMDRRGGSELGFYNGGEAGGASQRHKHLQLIPLPLDDRIAGLPIEPVITKATRREDKDRTVAGLPFAHALVRFDEDTSPQALLNNYRRMMESMSLAGDDASARGARHLAPYNLLVTRSWMLLVPRSAEFYGGISVNAIGFAGGLLVRNKAQLGLIREVGPMTVLRQVAYRRPQAPSALTD